MSSETTFHCDFCRERIVPNCDGWTYSVKPGPTTTHLSDKQWHRDLMANLKGPHICNVCVAAISMASQENWYPVTKKDEQDQKSLQAEE